MYRMLILLQLLLFLRSVYSYRNNLDVVSNLDGYVSPYWNCSTTIYIYNYNSIILEHISIPVTVVVIGENDISSPVVHHKSLKLMSCIAQFLLFPEAHIKKELWEILNIVHSVSFAETYLWKHMLAFGIVNIFTSLENAKEKFELERFRMRAITTAIFELNQISTEQNIVTYGIKNVKVLIGLSQLIRYISVENCLNAAKNCRNHIEHNINRITKNGRFLLRRWDRYFDIPEEILYNSEEINDTDSGVFSHLMVSVNKDFQPYLNNPFRFPFVKSWNELPRFQNLMYVFLGDGMDYRMYASHRDHYWIKWGRFAGTNYRIIPLETPKPEEIGYMVPMHYMFLQFATCNGVKSEISFSFYLHPFDSAIWVLLLCVSMMLLPALVVLEYYCILRTNKDVGAQYNIVSNYGNIVIMSLFFNCSVLVEATTNTPLNKKVKDNVEKEHYTKTVLILSVWTLLLVVLVNGYKGIYVSESVLPLPIGSLWKNVGQMEGFTFFNNYEVHRKIASPLWNGKLEEYGYEYGGSSAWAGCGCFKDNLKFFEDICNSRLKRIPSPLVSCEEPIRLMVELKFKQPLPTFNCSKLYKASEDILRVYSRSDNYERDIQANQTLLDQYSLIKRDLFGCHEPYRVIRKINNPNVTRRGNSPLQFINSLILYTRSHYYGQLSDLKFATNILSKCDKTAIIKYEFELDSLLPQAELEVKKLGRHVTFVRGEDELFRQWEGLAFIILDLGDVGWSRIYYKRLQFLLSSGIYFMFKRYYKFAFGETNEKIPRETLIAKSKLSLPKPLKLNSNVLSGLYIYLMCIVLGLVVFVLEFAYNFTMLNTDFSSMLCSTGNQVTQL